jgi:quinolinate synthase
MNELETLATVFDRTGNEIFVDPAVGERAMVPLQRMLDFARQLKSGVLAAD